MERDRRRRTVDERDADRAVLAALRARSGKATRADLVVATALPEMVVERSLERLLDAYESSVGVAGGGTLVYRFDPRLRRRRERRRVLRAVLGAAARTARVTARTVRGIVRAILAVQLLVYVMAVLLPVSIVLGVVVGIVFGIALIFSDGDAAGAIFSLLAEPEGALFFFGLCAVGGVGWVLKQKYDLLLGLVGARELDSSAGGLGGLVMRVNNFAVGPPSHARPAERTDRTWVVSRADERRVLERIREAGGRLRAGDLVQWLGLDLEDADRQATRIAVEYGGEPAAVERTAVEVVEFHFPSLLATADERAAPPAAPPPAAGPDPAARKVRLDARTERKRARAEARRERRQASEARRAAGKETRFERGDPPTPLTGNSTFQDGIILVFAAINLVAGLVGGTFLGPRRDDGAWWWLGWLAGGALPVGFSLLLPGLLVVRLPFHRLRRWLAQRRLARAALVKTIAAHAAERGDAPLDLDLLAADLEPPHGAPRPTPAAARRVAVSLGGEFDLDSAGDPGKTVWRFRRLASELAAAPPGAPHEPAAALRPVREADLVPDGR